MNFITLLNKLLMVDDFVLNYSQNSTITKVNKENDSNKPSNTLTLNNTL